MVLNVHRNHKAYEGRGEGGGGGGGGGGEIIYLLLHCHHQNDSCVQMGSRKWWTEVMDKVARQCPQTTTFLKRKESRSGIEPKSFCLPTQRLTARPNRLTLRLVSPWTYIYI